MSANEALKKVWNIFTTVVVVIIVLIAVLLMGSRLIGFRVFNVISGSMEPTYSVGDLLYVKTMKAEDIKVGDPITFVLNENLVVATHRVIEIDAEKQHFITKGDANDTIDAPVHFKNLIGKPMFAIPLLGYFSDWIQHPPGMYIGIGVGVLLIILLFLPDFIKKEKTADGKTEEELSEETKKEREELAQLREELNRQKAELEAARSKQEAPQEEPQETAQEELQEEPQETVQEKPQEPSEEEAQN